MSLFDDTRPAPPAGPAHSDDRCEHGRPGGTRCPWCAPSVSPTPQAAAAARAAGIAAADRHASTDWKARAWAALCQYLNEHGEFFVDDFWASGAIEEPDEPRALGALIQRAAREGLITKSGQHRPSVRSNMTAKPVWTSVAYLARQQPTAGAAGCAAWVDAHPGLLARAAAVLEAAGSAVADGDDLMAGVRWSSLLNGEPDPTDGAPAGLGGYCLGQLTASREIEAAA